MNDQTISLTDPVGSGTLQLIAKADRFNHWMYLEFKSQLKGEVLEAGSGIGNISQLVIKDGLNITLSDYNNEYCEWLKKKFDGISNVKGIIRIDLLHPDFRTVYSGLKEKFDSIFLLNVIEHLADDCRAIANCHFMMKPAGHLIILAPAYQWLYCRLDKELGHYRRYTTKTIKKILEKENFIIQKVNHFNFLGMWGWLLLGKVFQKKKLSGNEMELFNSIVPLAKVLDQITFKKMGLSIIGTAMKKNN
ncbi:MAG: class I SAM-dependent methyltransferase [Chitinophagales bacterium]